MSWNKVLMYSRRRRNFEMRKIDLPAELNEIKFCNFVLTSLRALPFAEKRFVLFALTICGDFLLRFSNHDINVVATENL